MKYGLVIFTLLGLCGCALMQTHEVKDSLPAAERQEIQQIEQSLHARDAAGALQYSEDFEKNHPYSRELQTARFLKAQALEDLGRWTEAAETYRAIISYSQKNQPDISALSRYRLSFVYEALGDDEKVVSSLLVLQKEGSLLPPEVVQAEIPSRLAMVYAKENNSSEAQKWLLAADEGLRKTLESHHEPLSNAWLARMYYNMGSISTDQISPDNILTLLQGQRAVQKYLIHSLQYGDPEWSAKARDRLQSTFQSFWNEIENAPVTGDFEPVVANKMKYDQQMVWVTPFEELIKEASLYRPGPEQNANTYQQDFFQFLDKMQGQVLSLFEKSYNTPLMMGQDKAPQHKNKSVKMVPSEDPNL